MRLVAAANLLVVATAGIAFAGSNFAHVQTDKPQYRLGETIFYRVHARPAVAGTTISLCRPDGSVAAKKTELDGCFVLAEDMQGGAYRLKVEAAGEVLHEVSLDVYELASKQLDMGLVVLGDLNEPGDEVTATISVRDLRGAPVEGARLAFRAAFGPLVVTGPAPATDAEGRALIRFQIPADAQRTGVLAVGVDAKGKTAAIARPVPVSSGIARIDALPEGGSVLPGGRHRFGLVARDLDGAPALCEGRVLDDKNKPVAIFRTDRRGLASVDFLYERERSYRVELDRPSHVKTPFPIPGATGHPYALRIEQDKGLIRALIRGPKGDAELVIVRADGKLCHESIVVKEEGTYAAIGTDEVYAPEQAILVVKGKALLAAPFLSGLRKPAKVAITMRETRALPGDVVTLDVAATDENGFGVSCDVSLAAVNEGVVAADAASDLAVRALVSKAVPGSCSDAAGLDDVGVEAYLLVHGALAYPLEGVAVTPKGPPAPSFVRLPAITMRTPPAAPGGGKSVSKGTALDRLMERASFTRFALGRPSSDETFGMAVEEGTLPDLPPKGKLPQDVASLRFDCRDTLLWRGKVVTNKEGRATATFRISSEVTPLVVLAQGFSSRGAPLGGMTRLTPTPGFAVRTPFPGRVTVGDVMESFIAVDVKDGQDLPFQISVAAPPCLKALDRTELTFDPRTSAREQKFRFEVVAPASEAKLQVVATRGAFRQVTTRVFTSGYREIELSYGRSGFDTACAPISFKIPADAVPGSVTASLRVATTSQATTQESIEKLLTEPHGCFEQTSAANYPNLTVLETLRKRGSDPALLERATLLVRQGFERLLRFQDPSGGFCLWFNNGQPAVRYTGMAVQQLSQYGRLFAGKGSFEMRRAMEWLDDHRKDVDSTTGLYVSFAAAEAGYAWPAAVGLLEGKPNNNYECALLALTAETWPAAWPIKKPKNELVGELADRLERDQDPKTGAVRTDGVGVMFSKGDPLVIETTALSALALARAGRARTAHGCLSYIENARASLQWYSTQALVLSVRASSELGPSDRRDGPLLLTFSANGRAQVVAAGDRERTTIVNRPLDAGPGSTVSLGLDFKSADPLSFGIACRYRVAKPQSSKDAAYEIQTTVPARIVSGEDTPLRVSLKKLADVEGQVVAKIALPGGCEPSAGQMAGLAGSAHYELEGGYLVLYWEKAPGTIAFNVQLRGVAPGSYVTAPSVIYPYYETGREAYAPSLETRVLGAFNMGAGGASLRGK